MNYLARRDHSRFELQQKLREDHFNIDEIESVLDALIAEGLQDDVRVAENHVRQRRQNGYGPERISYELESKDISKKIIKEIVNPDSKDWQQQMLSLLERRFPDPEAIGLREKTRFLLNRGYKQAEVLRCLNTERSEEYD